MKIVVAVGGNSLIKENHLISSEDQLKQAIATSKPIGSLIEQGHHVVIVHGNGPQVGFLLKMSENSAHEIPLFPLDYCVANTQGSIGYQLQNALHRSLLEKGITKSVVTIVTQVEVSPDDPAFQNPTKPIGSFLSKEVIEEYAKNLHWHYIEDSGRGYRRVVPSPKPLDIVEKEVINTLLENDHIVIAAGGGGIPVVKKEFGYEGIEAVIDKDFASSLLAIEIHADLFVISTAVEYAYIHFNQPQEKALREVKADQMEKYLKEGFFGIGSMEPKIKACIQFVRATNKPALITCPDKISEAIQGKSGTIIVSEQGGKA
ncbi:carbamate kinase [bacterium]|nr:carbamate kinase [bacterium]